MSLKDRVITNLEERREKLLKGEINSIPTSFPRFSEDFAGVEQGKYYLITSKTKGSKTQFSSKVFIYDTLLYAYYNPTKVTVKILYYPLEETPENVMERFMSYLVYTLSKGKIRISPKDLRSTNNQKPLPKEVLDLLKSEEYNNILDFFESNIIFSTSTNPTGLWKECKDYAEKHGTTHKKKITIIDEFIGKPKIVEAFDYYEQENPKEYRIIFFDHMSLVSTEKGMNLRETMSKLSEYFVLLRNRYKYTIVNIQQQAFFENTDAFKLDKLRPTTTNLADNKATSRDCNMCIGIYSPYAYEVPVHKGYDITKLKDHVRFIEILVNRDGQSNGVIALYFDGAVCYFKEMPLPSDKESLNAIYHYVENLYRVNYTFFAYIKKLVKPLLSKKQ